MFSPGKGGEGREEGFACGDDASDCRGVRWCEWCRGLLSERRMCRGLLCLFDVLMTSVGEDERDDSICLEWKTDLVP